MKPSRISRSAVWLGLVLQTAAALSFNLLVLCVGANGHVAVEWLADDDCCPEESSSTAFAPGDRCECTDAPLILRAVTKRVAVDPSESAAAPLSAAVAAIPASDLLAALSSGPPDCALPPPSVRLARRSVQLQL